MAPLSLILHLEIGALCPPCRPHHPSLFLKPSKVTAPPPLNSSSRGFFPVTRISDQLHFHKMHTYWVGQKIGTFWPTQYIKALETLHISPAVGEETAGPSSRLSALREAAPALHGPGQAALTMCSSGDTMCFSAAVLLDLHSNHAYLPDLFSRLPQQLPLGTSSPPCTLLHGGLLCWPVSQGGSYTPSLLPGPSPK